jgi:IclR family transcriptional regulator, KDG regulon repressor
VDSTLLKGLKILELVIKADAPVGVSVLAESLKLPKSNIHRALATLVEAKYLMQNKSGAYLPTLHIWEQGAKVIARHPLRRAAIPFLHALHHETNETVNLMVLEGDECLNVYQVRAPIPIRASMAPGSRAPVLFPASGKAILAFGPDPEKRVRSLYAKQKSKKPGLELNDLLKEIAVIKQQGYALSISGWREGINSVAGAIMGPDGLPAGAVSISGPKERLSEERMKSFANAVLNTCTHISGALGG